MPCYHPLTAYARRDLSTGKYMKPKFSMPSIDLEFKALREGNPYEELKLPCGQCIGCRLDYARQWATRCWLESKYHEHNYFVTLTYNDENLPFGEKGNPTLEPQHFKKFMHDLRQYFKRNYDEDNIRFFACGEYGAEHQRPHFHIILFNCNIRDLKYFKKNFQRDPIYRSAILERLWNKGYVAIGEVNYETCGYTARYMLKKHKGLDKDYYSDLGITPEFTRQSLKPGIGRLHFEDNCLEIYKTDNIPIEGSKRKQVLVPPPHYFDKLYEGVDLEHLQKIKLKRQESAKQKLYFKLLNTSYTEKELLLVEENARTCKIRSLQRTL